MRKKNILKRNSGFIVVSLLAAGGSFFGADPALNWLYQRSVEGQPETEETPLQPETGGEETDAPETYETDPFTITASGAVLKQVKNMETEEENGETEAAETDTQDETGEASRNQGDAPSGSEGDTGTSGQNSSGGDDTSQSGGGEDSASDGWSVSESQSGSAGGDSSHSDGSGSQSWDGSGENSSGGSSWDGSYSDPGSGDSSAGGDGGWSGDSYGQGGGVVIVDPGDSTYVDNSWNEGSGGSGSSDGSGGSGSSGDGSYENGIYSPDDLILWHINSRYIGEEELYNYDAATIRLIRNEIFALHGRIFRSEDLQAYFGSKSWYVPTYDPDEFDANMESILNDYELANLNVILAYEAALYG